MKLTFSSNVWISATSLPVMAAYASCILVLSVTSSTSIGMSNAFGGGLGVAASSLEINVMRYSKWQEREKRRKRRHNKYVLEFVSQDDWLRLNQVAGHHVRDMMKIEHFGVKHLIVALSIILLNRADLNKTDHPKGIIRPNFPTIQLIEQPMSAHIGPHGSDSVWSSCSCDVKQRGESRGEFEFDQRGLWGGQVDKDADPRQRLVAAAGDVEACNMRNQFRYA
jgi:hypothetical protein